MMPMQSLNILCQKISEYFQGGHLPDSIFGFRPLVQAYEGSDWQSYVAYGNDCYTRHYVEQNAHFEMLILCWKSGQGSPVHNHAERGCILKVLQGQLLETRYQKEKVTESLYLKGELTYIDDQIGWHKIHNPGDSHTVSLHIYSPGFFTPQIMEEFALSLPNDK